MLLLLGSPHAPRSEEQEVSTLAGVLGVGSHAMLGWNGRASPDKVKLLFRSESKMLLQDVLWVCLLGQQQSTDFLSLNFVLFLLPSLRSNCSVMTSLPAKEHVAAHLALPPPLWNSVFPAREGAGARFSHQVSGVCWSWRLTVEHKSQT